MCTHPVDDGAVLKKNRCTLESKDPLNAVRNGNPLLDFR